MSSLPSNYSETVKLAQQMINFHDDLANSTSPLLRFIADSEVLREWIKTVRQHASVIRFQGYMDAEKARDRSDKERTAFLTKLLLFESDAKGRMVLEIRPSIEITSGEYEVYKRGACQALNLDPFSGRPLREIFKEAREDGRDTV